MAATERELAETLARQCAQALERARLYAAEASARSRTERLQRMTAALGGDPRRGGGRPPDRLGGHGRARRDRRRPDAARGRRRAGAGGDRVSRPTCSSPGQRMPLDAPLPLVEVLRTGEPFWFESEGDWPASFPARRGGMSSVAVGLPLSAHGALTGAVAFRFSEDERRFSAEEREHALALAAQCSSALERARLHDAEQRAREAAERAEDRARLLADVSLALDAPVGPGPALRRPGARGRAAPGRLLHRARHRRARQRPAGRLPARRSRQARARARGLRGRPVARRARRPGRRHPLGRGRPDLRASPRSGWAGPPRRRGVPGRG